MVIARKLEAVIYLALLHSVLQHRIFRNAEPQSTKLQRWMQGGQMEGLCNIAHKQNRSNDRI